MRIEKIPTAHRLLTMLLAVGVLVSLSVPALAAPFSFGSIAPTDLIQSLVIVPGQNGTTTTYTSADQRLVIDGYVSTINFLNRGPINVNLGDVIFNSALDLVTMTYAPYPSFLVTNVSGQFSKPAAADYSIVDIAGTGGGPIAMLIGDFNGNLTLDIESVTNLILGTTSADLLVSGGMPGDADFISAFGSAGHLGGTPAIATGGSNLCDTIVTCGTPAQLSDFTSPSVLTLLTNNVVPEPSSGLLVALGMACVALWRRRTSPAKV